MSSRQVVRTSDAPVPVAPYSQGVVSDRLVFTAGSIGLDPASTTLVEGGAAAEADQVLDNLAAVLAAADSGLDLVLKSNIYLVDMADYAPVNEVYSQRMPEPYPARTTVVVQALPGGARVEIEMVAAVRAKPS